jgi:acetyl esterase/lipase
MLTPIFLILVASLAGCGAAAGPSDTVNQVQAVPATDDQKTVRPGPWTPPDGLVQTPIWPGAAPDMENLTFPTESVLVAQTPQALFGTTSEAALDVSTPTITVFPARGNPNGAAILVFPGGGFKAVVLTLQGTEICDWVTAQGIACVLLKYRVPKTAHHYDAACDCGVEPDRPRALQDAQRAIRLVRSRASELGIDQNRIGVMGFSAGGYLAVQTSNIFAPAYTPVDAIDQVSSRPDFAIAFYPGHLCRPGEKLPAGLKVTPQTPPTFLIAAWDDSVNPICNTTLYARALDEAGVPSEVHLFAKGGHAFARRTPEERYAVWPRLVEGWLRERGILGD